MKVSVPNGWMLGVNSPQGVAIVGEVEFAVGKAKPLRSLSTSVSHRRRSLRSAAALGLPPAARSFERGVIFSRKSWIRVATTPVGGLGLADW